MKSIRKSPLREVREEMGLSQYDMSLLLGVSSASYYQAENGHYRSISHFEERLKEMGLLSVEEDLAGDYELWRKEKVEHLKKKIQEKIK